LQNPYQQLGIIEGFSLENTMEEKKSDLTLGEAFVMLLVSGLGLYFLYFFFSTDPLVVKCGQDGEINFAWPPDWDWKDNISASINITPESYVVDEQGTLSVTIKNASEHKIQLSSVEIQVPGDFFGGFQLTYPEMPILKKIKYPLFKSNRIIVLELDNHIEPRGAYMVEVPITANITGDYSGKYKASVISYSCSGHHVQSDASHQFNIVILPPAK